jgi:NADP-dependent 3-hydroxy acid dehydrogenase YdfG
MSIAHRFGQQGHRVALVSRTDIRHAGYLASLTEAGIQAASFVADVRDRAQVISTIDAITERFDHPEIVYYGPAALDPADRPKPITEVDRMSVHNAMSWLYAAVEFVGAVLPGMIERGSGGLLLAGGLSSVVPMPALGSLALSSAALRNYAVTLNAALAERGIYAGTLTIGGLIERGDIHRFVVANPQVFGSTKAQTLNPDDIADVAWDLYTKRDRAEAVFNALA